MATPIRTDQSASDVATGEATKVEHYNNLRDDVDLAQTEFDKGTSAAIAAATPVQAQAVVDTDNDELFVSTDGVDFRMVAPLRQMMGSCFSAAGSSSAYVGIGQGGSGWSEEQANTIIPYPIVVMSMYVHLESAPNNATHVSLRKNGAAAGMTVTITSPSTTGSTVSTTGISFAAGDVMCAFFDNGHTALMLGNWMSEVREGNTL